LCRCRWENTAYGSFDENKGLLIAMFIRKLKQLKIRAKRDGAFEYRIIDSTKVIKSYIRKQIVY
jgi:hypothetical protein